VSGFQFEFEPAGLEHDFLREATLWLAVGGVFEWRNNTGVARNPETGQHVRFGIPGGSDLLCVVPPFGRFLGVETKAADGRQSKKQKVFEMAVKSAGGVYVLARTLEDVRRGYEEAQQIPGLAKLIADERHACRVLACTRIPVGVPDCDCTSCVSILRRAASAKLQGLE
jgi:hypothetical protein